MIVNVQYKDKTMKNIRRIFYYSLIIFLYKNKKLRVIDVIYISFFYLTYIFYPYKNGYSCITRGKPERGNVAIFVNSSYPASPRFAVVEHSSPHPRLSLNKPQVLSEYYRFSRPANCNIPTAS